MKKCLRLCKDAKTRGWNSRVTRNWQAAKVGTRVKHAGELKSYASCCTTGQKSQAGPAISSQLASHQKVAHVPSMLEAEESRQLLHYRTKVPGWPGCLLAALTRDSTESQDQVAKTPCLGKTNFSHSFSPYFIYTLIPTILRELPKRILREALEKTKIDSSTIFT